MRYYLMIGDVIYLILLRLYEQQTEKFECYEMLVWHIY